VITRDSFSRSLRSERERRGITLEAIAESTKIRRSILLALETGDLSKLPGGIFQRAFVRAYAEAVGLAPDELLTEISQLCPESIGGLDLPGSGAGRMRLTLEPAAAWEAAPVRRGLAAVGDTGAILVVAGVMASVTSVNPWAVLGPARTKPRVVVPGARRILPSGR
jgi:transcriptional regulator with XRE-family HTH domain